MALALNRLNARRVATIATPGRHADGGGLCPRRGFRRATVAFPARGKPDRSRLGTGKLREMGLGPVRDVPLAGAREAAAKARLQMEMSPACLNTGKVSAM